ncbi:electron transfer flavoprotein subunit beta/FixA family protein [Thermodesulfobacteriota bacterium]
MFQIIVCIKAVPDPQKACKIKIDPITKTLLRCEVPLVMNPLDRNALEAALNIKEEIGAHVTIISMGPIEAVKIVKEGIAIGADHGVLLTDPAFAGADVYSTAFTLSKGIEKINDFDLVICGMASSDAATEWVGPEIATFLSVPVVTKVKEIVHIKDKFLELKTCIMNGYRRVRVMLPALITVTRELNKPRALSFSGIIKSRKKKIMLWGCNDINVSEKLVGLNGSPSIVTTLEPVVNKRNCEFITGCREEKADKLIDKLVEHGFL